MKCPICARENRPEESWCGACGASMGSGGSMPHALPTGTELAGGSYTVVHALAQGGFGITYQCIDNRLKIPVAIKEFFPMGCGRSGQSVLPTGGWTRGTYADGRTRFLQEAETLAKFDHPGIVRVRAAFEENDTAYFVMEFLRGRTLAEVLVARNAPFEEGAVVAYLDRMAQALEVVHGAGLLHRDLKPSNVMVTDDGRVALIDFGTAREYASELSQSHSTVLTAGYAPLEQYSRHGQRGPATDIYALAATGWHLLTGAPPPAATDRAVGIPLPSLRRICPSVSEALAVAFERGLEMVSGQRPQSVAEFCQMLRGQSGQIAVGAASGSGHSASVQAHVEQAALTPPPAPPLVTAVPPPPTVASVTPSPGPSATASTVVASESGAPRSVGGWGGGVGSRSGAGAHAGKWGLALGVVVLSVLLVSVFTTNKTSPTSGAASATKTTSPFDDASAATYMNPKDGMQLVRIPGGTYTIGSNSGHSDEKPVHRVTLEPYAIGKTEVTNAQFRSFVNATGHKAGGDWERYARDWGEDSPVVNVSWNDANAYCAWAGLRLPTEAEWEVAARGPDGLEYPWGNEWDPAKCRNSVGRNSDSAGKPVPVGSYPADVSPFGCLDMAGNVWEWCSSKYKPYPYGASDGREDPAGGEKRALRGGSWYYVIPRRFRGAYRVRDYPASCFNDGGFRSARTL